MGQDPRNGVLAKIWGDFQRAKIISWVSIMPSMLFIKKNGFRHSVNDSFVGSEVYE